MKNPQNVLRELAKPFPPVYVHSNPSGGGSYVKHHVVEQRMIQVLGIPPRFTLIEILRGDVPAIPPNPEGKSKRAKEGRPALQNVIVGVVARMEIRLGGEWTWEEECGDCEEPHNWTTDGQRLKDAMSDAYKRCAMRFGCGLHLWSQNEFFLYDVLGRDLAGSREVSTGSEHGPTTPPGGGKADPASASPSAESPAERAARIAEEAAKPRQQKQEEMKV